MTSNQTAFQTIEIECLGECANALKPCPKCANEGCQAQMHAKGLMHEIELWSFNGVDYFWTSGHLYYAFSRTEESEWTEEEKRKVRILLLFVAVVNLLEIAACVGFILFALR